MYELKNILPPNKNSRFKQGTFDEYSPKKYFGNTPITYRSSWELKYMLKLERDSNVEKWSSESIHIPYLTKEKKDGKFNLVRHEYWPDFTIHFTNGKKYIVEIKPSNQTPLNESQIKRNPVMYKNACKWRAAIEWCKHNGYEFKIVTEKDF